MDWPLYQLTVEGARAYQNLYDNHNGLRDSWAAYWGVMASNFSHFDNLFGYDLMNEPFAGDIYRNPLLLFPGVADQLNLQAFYEVANTEIRKYDKKSIVVFEGLTWDNFRIGFTDVPGGNEYRNRTGLSYHFYPSGPYLFRMAGTFRERLADAKRLGCGLLMTEFDGPNSFASQWDIVETADNFLQR
jgi:endoglycosylceramidase